MGTPRVRSAQATISGLSGSPALEHTRSDSPGGAVASAARNDRYTVGAAAKLVTRYDFSSFQVRSGVNPPCSRMLRRPVTSGPRMP